MRCGEKGYENCHGSESEKRCCVPPSCGYRVGPILMEPLYVLRAWRRVGEADEMESGCGDGGWRNRKC